MTARLLKTGRRSKINMVTRVISFLALSLLVGSADFAWAKLPTVNLENLRLNPGGRESLVLDSGDGLRIGELWFAAAAQYEHKPLLFAEGDDEVSALISSRTQLHLAAAYGITDWLELSLELPIILYQPGENVEEFGFEKPAQSGMGTPWLQLRSTFLREDNGAPIDLSLSLALSLPLGSEDALARDPSPGIAFAPTVALGHTFNSVHLGGSFGMVFRSAERLSALVADEEDTVGTDLRLAVGASTLGTLRGEVLAQGIVPLSDAPASFDLLGGLRYKFESIGLDAFLLAGPGIGDTPGTPLFRALLGVGWKAISYTPCMEGRDYAIADCPDLDRDDDGVPNGQDMCPFEPGLIEIQGCPDSDDDGDGIMNTKDRCPNTPGLEKYEGCEPPDRDQDGFIDEEDECPDEPGVAELKGCPVRDRDGDTIPDHLDQCPDEPGTVEENGCPKVLVVMKKGKLELREMIFFVTGKADIDRRSDKLLDQIAKVLNDHPEVQEIRIDGHTDNVGNKKSNLKLSKARANSVRAALIERGVKGERLKAQGYGQDMPLVSNSTPQGREQNRRVEFNFDEPEEK